VWSGAMRCSPWQSPRIFAHACKLGFEGIVSKRRDHPYRSGPSKAWIKVKSPMRSVSSDLRSRSHEKESPRRWAAPRASVSKSQAVQGLARSL
jgi:hypothetical protein